MRNNDANGHEGSADVMHVIHCPCFEIEDESVPVRSHVARLVLLLFLFVSIIVSIVDQKQVGFALGAVDYLIKPIRKPVLLETIRKYVLPQSDDEAILLVDDDPRALELLEETLRSAGYEVESVRSGTRALEVLSSKLVSAVLLDLLMPGMDGFEVIRHIRQEATLRELPIFVMTAKNLTGDELLVLTRETQALFHKNGSWQQQLMVEVGRILQVRKLAKSAGQS